MPRTTQSAKRSTGAPAPRLNLLTHAASIPAAKKSLKKKKKSAHTTSVARARRNKRGIIDTITVIVQAEVPTHVLKVEVQGPVNEKADMDQDHDEWCTSCQNGGDCYCCDHCLRVICSRCLIVPEDACSIKCPACHLYQKTGGLNKDPYIVNGKEVKYRGNSTRESFPRCVSEPLAIISITLQGVPDNGPQKAVYEHLLPYLQGNACYVNIDFNFGTPEDSESFTNRLNSLIEMFQGGQLQRFRRFLVFLTTHSDPERGDLHIMPGGEFAAATDQVFQLILGTTEFGELLKQSRDSVLTLVSCGAAVKFVEPLQALRDISSQKYFHEILTFTQDNLQGSFASIFLQDYALHRFIHRKENIFSYIYQHQILGAHTDLILFGSGLMTGEKKFRVDPTEATILHILWSHNGRRPLGNNSPPQCPNCLALKPWNPKQKDSQIAHACKNCGRMETYSTITGTVKIRPPGPRGGSDDRGCWLYKKI